MNRTLSTTSMTLPGSSTRSLPRWLREPLLHFLLLGALLFAIDYFFIGRADDPRRILVDAAVDQQAVEIFQAARGRAPNADELHALRRVWLDNEVLYREGLALGVDKGDPAIRERVIFKALSIVDANVKLPPFDDKLLADWFEKNRVKYDEPPRYDLEEAVLAGDRSEAAVRAFVENLRRGAPGEQSAGLRVFKGRPLPNILQSYGEAFARGLEQSAPHEWVALPSSDGWRAVQVGAVIPARPAVFETLRGVVLQDWTDATLAQQRSDAVRVLTRKYLVKYESENK